MPTTLDWLLEKENPSVRYFALTQLLDRTADDPDVRSAQRAIMRSDPIKAILAAQNPTGFWLKPGTGYGKYQSTTWQILFLAELGCDGQHRAVRRGCEYVLSHTQAEHGGFSPYAIVRPSGAIHCLSGNLTWALIALGCGEDERIGRAIDWLSGAITGDGFDAFYAAGTSGPGFSCGINLKQPCAWGAVKALRALTLIPAKWRSPRTDKATRLAAEFLLSHDLAKADYPYTERISGEWFKFGFPLSYTSDVLETALVLSEAGYARDPRLARALDLILSKRDASGRWALKHSLNGKMWIDIEQKGQPSKWITLRALRVLKMAGLEGVV
ncbi:MAG: nitrogen fixation protein NifH [Anaerolineae bacterium]